MTSNISITKDRAGNVKIPATSSLDTDRSWVHELFPPHHLPATTPTLAQARLCGKPPMKTVSPCCVLGKTRAVHSSSTIAQSFSTLIPLDIIQ